MSRHAFIPVSILVAMTPACSGGLDLTADGAEVTELSTDGKAAVIVERAYRGILGRSADAGGQAAYAALLIDGLSLVELAVSLFDSPEFQDTRGGLPPVQLAEALYQGILERTADAGGLQATVQMIEAGQRAERAAAMLDSQEMCDRFLGGDCWTAGDPDPVPDPDPDPDPDPAPEPEISEFQAGVVVEHAYRGILGRGADAGGLRGYVDFLVAGGSIVSLCASLFDSEEFAASRGGLSPADLADALYAGILGRDADAEGRAATAAQIAGGNGPARAAEMLLSPEFCQSFLLYRCIGDPDPGPGPGPGPDPNAQWPQYAENPFTIFMAQKEPRGGKGGIFVHDLNGDNLLDYVVTGNDRISAYDHYGATLWAINDEIRVSDSANGGFGYPGPDAPAAIAGDLDNDGQQEIAYVTKSRLVRVRDGRTGSFERNYSYPGAQSIAVANFRGAGDQDAVVQFSQREIRAVNLVDGSTLWHRTDWWGVEHSQVRVADVDGDGLDEVIGPVFVDHDGQIMNSWDVRDRGAFVEALDSLAIGDIVPGGGLEVALAEQSGTDETIVAGASQIYWGVARPPQDIPDIGDCTYEKDPDKIAVGNFDPTRPGLEIFARSACGHAPWVHDASGQIVSSWNLLDTAPPGWCTYYDCGGRSSGGIDAVRALDWNGDGRHLLWLLERHIVGNGAIVDPLTGDFLRVIPGQITRTYTADVSGDYREEIIVVERHGEFGKINIYHNDAPNPRSAPRPWAEQHYRRTRQNYNYYSQ